MNTVILIDKSPGITSFELLKEIEKILNLKKPGHCGTLDKFASGLLVVCAGWTRKLTHYFLESDKRYTGVLKLGISTDTCDSEGQITGQKGISDLDPGLINSIPAIFSGWINQTPPLYSAVKIRGKRASDLMRSGKQVELKERKINIKKLEIAKIDLDNSNITIDVSCSKGTYIRALARDIGDYIKTGAYLQSLRRTECGDFKIENAATLDEIKEYSTGKDIKKKFRLKPEEALSGFSSISIRDNVRNRILNGVTFQKSDIVRFSEKAKKPFTINDEAGNLIAIADVDTDNWRVKYLNVFNKQE